MFRKDLLQMLLDDAMTVKQISRAVGQKDSTTVSDLEHLFKSLKHQGYRALIEPSVCRKCEFTFGSEKLSKPSKCPKCKSVWLTEPRIQVVPA
jgi:predicted Zn-ribbon and HTH transcriptional regulator